MLKVGTVENARASKRAHRPTRQSHAPVNYMAGTRDLVMTVSLRMDPVEFKTSPRLSASSRRSAPAISSECAVRKSMELNRGSQRPTGGAWGEREDESGHGSRDSRFRSTLSPAWRSNASSLTRSARTSSMVVAFGPADELSSVGSSPSSSLFPSSAPWTRT
jgi:hypothetical protein